MQRDLWLIFVCAALLRLVQMILSFNQLDFDAIWALSPDSLNYVKIAKDFLAGTNDAERFLFVFGPGYAAFIAPSIALFGDNPAPIILVQVLLSSYSCVLIYQLAGLLTHSRPVAVVAAGLAVVSYTSISLSCTVLSDTLFFFLILLALVLYLRGLESGRWGTFVAAGILTGYAILVRCIGQFWPVILLLVALLWLALYKRSASFPPGYGSKPLIIRVLVCILIVVSIEGSWILRNYSVHGVATLTSASTGGPANVAAFTLEKLEGVPSRHLRPQFWEQHAREQGMESATIESAFYADLELSRRVFKNHPKEMIKTYFSLCWENMNKLNKFPRVLLPHFKPQLMEYEYFWFNHQLFYICFILSTLGIIVLLLKRQFYPAAVLVLIYAYFALMIGCTRWQGSRLFYPGQISWAILVAVLLASVTTLLSSGWRRVLSWRREQ